jgi:hypothetical protein
MVWLWQIIAMVWNGYDTKDMDLADGDGRLKSESVVRLSVAYT